jgi:uncharacterized protein
LRTREEILASRWIKPFAHRLAHPSLWHINRRSLSRALGIGLFAAFIVPVGQIVLAAFLAIPARANVPVAIGATLVTNPFTFGPIYLGAYWLGTSMLGAVGLGDWAAAPADGAYATTALQYMGPVTIGLLAFAVLAGAMGYLCARLWLRLRLTMRWRARRPA